MTSLFKSKNVYVGGIYPFRIPPHTHHYDLRLSKRFVFKFDFPEKEEFKKLRRHIYSPEQLWLFPSSVLSCNFLLPLCILTTRKQLNLIHGQAYISIYSLRIATIIFWLDFSDYTLERDEITELNALARGTHERIVPNKRPVITIRFDQNHKTKKIADFVEICQLLEEDFKSLFVPQNIREGNNKIKVQFVYPILFIGEVINCYSKSEILKKHSRDITAITNLWIYAADSLDQNEINRTLTTDFHSFDFGLSLITLGCTAEFHPHLTKYIPKAKIPKHLKLERSILTFISEIPITEFYILRIYDAELSGIQLLTLPSKVLFLYLLNPFYVIKLIFQAISLTIIQRNLTLEINQFRRIYLLRETYLKIAFDTYSDLFALSSLEERINNKMQSLTSNVNSIYSMLTTVAALFLSIAAIFIAVFQLFL